MQNVGEGISLNLHHTDQIKEGSALPIFVSASATQSWFGVTKSFTTQSWVKEDSRLRAKTKRTKVPYLKIHAQNSMAICYHYPLCIEWIVQCHCEFVTYRAEWTVSSFMERIYFFNGQSHHSWKESLF